MHLDLYTPTWPAATAPHHAPPPPSPTLLPPLPLPHSTPPFCSPSIASAPIPGEGGSSFNVQITVGKDSKSGTSGASRNGVCSHWVPALTEGTKVKVWLNPAIDFRLPLEAPDSRHPPCILVGAGTGCAPFRGFWRWNGAQQHREHSRFRDMYLYLGFQSPAQEPYREEMAAAVESGALRAYTVAYSRVPDIMPKTYVQDLLKQPEHATLMLRLLREENAHIYICGGVRMAVGVRKALKSVLQGDDGSAEAAAAAEAEIQSLGHRFHEDLFGNI